MKFETIYKEYYKKITIFISRRINDEMTAEELASDVMLKIHKNLHSFDPEKSLFNTWIINIAKNTMIDYCRKKKLNTISIEKMYVDWANENDVKIDKFMKFKDDELNPEEQMIDKEVSRSMYEKFESLKEDEKIIASLHYFDGLSYDEIVEQLNMPLGTVKAKLHKARVKMMDAVPVEVRKLNTF